MYSFFCQCYGVLIMQRILKHLWSMTDWLTEEWQWIYLAAESCLATCANTLERSHLTSCQRWLRNESNWILQSAQIDRIWFLILNNKDDFSLITLQSQCSQSSEVEALSAQSGSAQALQRGKQAVPTSCPRNISLLLEMLRLAVTCWIQLGAWHSATFRWKYSYE